MNEEQEESVDRRDPFNFHKCNSSAFRTKSLRVIVPHLRKQEVKFELFSCQTGTLEMFECQFCYFKHNLKIAVDRHETLVHGGHSPDPEFQLKGYVCDKCDFETHSLLVFARHVCDDSQVKLPVLKKQTKPKRRVVSDKWFECEQCLYKSKFKGHLNRHVLVRHAKPDEVKYFECSQCSFKTKRKDNLKRHTNIHLNPDEVRWFECEHCPYKSVVKGNLRNHIFWKHSNNDEVKWFKCELCPYKSKENSVLGKHIYNKHTLDKDKIWFRCDKCSLKTTSKYYLKTHMSRIHHILIE